MRHHWIIVPLLILITLATFWRALACQFVLLDDPTYVTKNPHVQQGLTAENITWAFTTGYAANYHPLTWLSLMLDRTLWGAGPRGYHLTNVLLHILAVVLLYLALHALTGAPWRSALVALLFGVHPLRVESVAWITERKDVLSGCVAFAAILAYAAYAHRPNWIRYLRVAAFFALGLLAKPMLVTLPCLLLLLDIWPLRRVIALSLPAPSPQAQPCPKRSAGALVLEKIPLLLLSVASCVVTYVFQLKGGSISDTDEVPIAMRLPNILVAYVRYLEKMVWFKGLGIYLYIPPWPLWIIAGSFILLAVITAATCLRFRRNPWLAIGWFWYLGMLVPVIGFIQVGVQSMADRYSYLPTIGLLIMLVWSLPQRLFQTRPLRLATGGAAMVAVAVLSAFTWHQIGYWQNPVTFLKHASEVSPNSDLPMMDLGILLDSEQHRPWEALFYLRKAVAVAPQSALAHLNLGILLMHLDKADEALFHLSQAVSIQPNLYQAYYSMGAIYVDRHQFDLAKSAFQRALEANPKFALAHVSMGNILTLQNQLEEAATQYREALKLKPEDTAVVFKMANVFLRMGKFQDALPLLREVARRQPNKAPAYASMSWVLMKLNQPDEAIASLRKAIQLDPGNPRWRALLTRVQAVRKRPDQASQPAQDPANPR